MNSVRHRCNGDINGVISNWIRGHGLQIKTKPAVGLDLADRRYRLTAVSRSRIHYIANR